MSGLDAVKLAAIAVLAMTGCFNPTYNDPSCGPAGECPGGLVCSAGTCVGAMTGGDGGARDGTRDGTGEASPDARKSPNVMLVQSIDPGYATNTRTIPISLTGGNLVLAAAYSTTLDQPIVLTDTTHLTWTSAPAIALVGSCGPMLQLFYAQVPQTVTDSITITQTAVGIGMDVLEYSGIATTSPVDVTGGIAGSGASNIATTGTITTTTTDMIFVLFADANGTGPMVAGSGWATRASDASFYALAVDNAPGVVAGAYDATATLPAGRIDACWASAVIALRVQN